MADMADDLTEGTEGNVLHSNQPKPKRQSGKTSMLLMNEEITLIMFQVICLYVLFFAELSSSRAKKPGRGEVIKDEKQR